jgi:hypothetical protein
MTKYSDVPQVNALYAEQQTVQSAIEMLDDGGTVSSLTVAPAPPPEDAPMMRSPMQATRMSVSIASVDTSKETLTAVRAQLAARDSAITAELNALGVT